MKINDTDILRLMTLILVGLASPAPFLPCGFSEPPSHAFTIPSSDVTVCCCRYQHLRFSLSSSRFFLLDLLISETPVCSIFAYAINPLTLHYFSSVTSGPLWFFPSSASAPLFFPQALSFSTCSTLRFCWWRSSSISLIFSWWSLSSFPSLRICVEWHCSLIMDLLCCDTGFLGLVGSKALKFLLRSPADW